MAINNLTYTDDGMKFTEQFESCRLTAYYDLKGILTVGWGHTGPEVMPGLVWTQAQADAALLVDVQRVAQTVNTLVTISLTQNEFNALCDFAYNCGCTAFRNSTMLSLLNHEQYDLAAEQFALWDMAGGKVVAGLIRRRTAEKQEFQ